MNKYKYDTKKCYILVLVKNYKQLGNYLCDIGAK